MKVVILCGGRGTRIRDVSEDLPKPMIPIGKEPILKHIMDIYSTFGHDEFILCLGYLGWRIRYYFFNFQAEQFDTELNFAERLEPRYLGAAELPPWKVTLADTGLDALTGARVSRIKKYVGDETFMLTYGDGLADVDLGELERFHRAHGKLVTVTGVRPPSRFGELNVSNGQVNLFHEKPSATAGGLVNGGFFICEPGIFDYLDDAPTCTLEQEPLQRLARDGELMAFPHDGFWMPMDTAREYMQLNDMWRAGGVPWHPDQLRDLIDRDDAQPEEIDSLSEAVCPIP